MAEYTFKNIIINPTKEGIESLIGKEVYFHNNPSLCLDYANKKTTDHLGVLVKILKNSPIPFTIKQGDTVNEYSCIIEKKEEPKPEFIPFKNISEFLNAYRSVASWLGEQDLYLNNRGIWLKDKDIDGVFYIVTEIWKDGVVLGSDQSTTKWDDLLFGYTFLDGTPCGRLVK